MPRKPPPVQRKRKPPPEARPMHPWERQPHETLAAFEKFTRLRDATASARNYATVASAFGVTRTRIEQLARKYAWQTRLAAWDEHLDRIAQQTRVDEVVDMNRRQAQLGQAMQGVAASKLTALQSAPMKARDVAALAVNGAKIERVARGEPSEIAGETPMPSAPVTGGQEESRGLARQILSNPRALRAALELERALEADPGKDG